MSAKKKSIDKQLPTLDFTFRLVAISSQLNLNKILWKLNKDMGWDITKRNDTEHNLGYSIFTDTTSIYPAILTLMANNQPNGVNLIKQLANIDYIIEITGEISNETFAQIIKGLKQIDNIQAAIEIPPSSIKHKAPFYIE